MRLNYLLDDTVLFGGVKVVLLQANLLAERGHQVTVTSRGPRPDWFDLRTEFLRVEQFTRDTVPSADVTVATYWTTIAAALDCATHQAVHYCQGLEYTYTHNTSDHPAIEAAYRLPLPAFVVSEHLGPILSTRFDRPSRLVLQPLERFWKPSPLRRWKRRPGHPPRILVTGPWEGDWKGVRTGLEAVRHLRSGGRNLQLIRLSQYPLRDEERAVCRPDEYHHHLKPEMAAQLVQGCDLLLAPSWEQEGFGLPTLEAFAAGVPVVASDISSFRAFASEAAVLVPPEDPQAFAGAAETLLDDPGLWRARRSSGFATAEQFSLDRAARSAEEAFEWATSGRWRLGTEASHALKDAPP